MRYRSRTDLISQILEAANGDTTKTRIMYDAYLSYAQPKEYLSMLIGNGLLEHDVGMQQYKTTEKGMKFLTMYANILRFTDQMKKGKGVTTAIVLC